MKEWEQWKVICVLLKASGAVTEGDLKSRESDNKTLGQKILQQIRAWGELRYQQGIEK